MDASKPSEMKAGRPTARVFRLRLVGFGVAWIALVFWAGHYRMPYDLRMTILLWSLAAGAAVGLVVGLWKNGTAALRARTGKGRWKPIGMALRLGITCGIVVGIPIFSLLVGSNGTFRSSTPFIVDGTVASEYETHGRGSGYYVVVREEQPVRYLKFTLGRQEFQRTRVGDHYHEEFQIGLFGWPCR